TIVRICFRNVFTSPLGGVARKRREWIRVHARSELACEEDRRCLMEGRDGNRAARSTDKAVSTNVSPRAPSQALGLSAAFTAAVRRPHHWGRIPSTRT